MKAKLYILIVAVATLVAQASAALACSSGHYQPRMPKSLLKK